MATDRRTDRLVDAVESRIERVTYTYTTVFAACARYGMKEESCARVARHAAKDLRNFLDEE